MTINSKLFAKLAHGFANDPKIVGLSDSAFRAYIEALLYSCQHMTDGFLDARIVARYGWAVVADELATNDVEPSWVAVDGGYVIHAFCDWQMTTAAHEKKVEAGRAGGLAKAKSQQLASKPLAGATKVLEQKASKALLEEDIDIDIDKDLTPLALTAPSFDEFWQLWPRREGKASAVRAWAKAVKKITDAELLAKVRAYVASPNRPEKQFIPHAATWLNGERWNDELELAQPHHHAADNWMYENPQWGVNRGQ
jgi:hypothetical protein